MINELFDPRIAQPLLAGWLSGAALGVAVDAYHVWWDPDLPRQIARAGTRIVAYHVCDWLVPTKDMLLDRGMPGDGVIDLREGVLEGWGLEGLGLEALGQGLGQNLGQNLAKGFGAALGEGAASRRPVATRPPSPKRCRASVGQARMHSGPPSWKLQRSHFTATVLTPTLQASSGSSAADSVGCPTLMPATPETGVPDGVMAPNGQAIAHILQPMHFCSFSSTCSPVSLIASTGQTRAQGASSQCRHSTGAVTSSVRVTVSRGCACSPTARCTDEQAAMQVLQPMHRRGFAMTKRFMSVSPS